MAIDTAGFALWNKLVRRTLVTENDLLPTEGIDFWEDLSVSCRAIAPCAEHIHHRHSCLLLLPRSA